jgi:hypothetical protein
VFAGFPIGTFLAVQVSSLRYQSDAVIKIQQVSIALDLLLQGWFFYRHHGAPGYPFRRTWVRNLLAYVSLPLVLVLDLLYLNVPGKNADTVRTADPFPNWSEAYKQPLDLVLCPTLQWGCRYLTVDHRTLVGHVWKPEAIADLRAERMNHRALWRRLKA